MFKLTGRLLFLIHLFLWIWSIGGMSEWLLPNVPWQPYSNPLFPDWLLFFHWIVVIFASSGFLYGYLTRWEYTPSFMIIGYGLMALICLIETLGYLISPYRYLLMFAEYSAYIFILFILHSNGFRNNVLNTSP